MDLTALIQQCAPNVGPDTIKAIMRVESNFRSHVIGFKVVGRDKRVYTLTSQPKTEDEAVSWATWLYDNGYKFDAGIIQINSTNFKLLGLTPQTVFEPCANIKGGAWLLQEAYDRAVKQYGRTEAALHAAISVYQSGNFVTGFKTGYVAKVAAAAGASAPTAVRPPMSGGQPGTLAPALVGNPSTFTNTATTIQVVIPATPRNPYNVSSRVDAFSGDYRNPPAWGVVAEPVVTVATPATATPVSNAVVPVKAAEISESSLPKRAAGGT